MDGLRRWLPWCLLAAAVFFYYLTVLRVDLFNTGMLDLEPGPDAVEYYALARSLLDTGRAEIPVGFEHLPSRYPPGYPALMLPWLALLPENVAITAPFRTNQALGFGLLLLTFTFFYRRSRPVGAGLAALLLAAQPSFITFARAPMSEMSAAFAVMAAFMLLSGGVARDSRPRVYLAAALLGLGLNVRLQIVFFAPLLPAMYFVGSGFSTRSRLLHTAGCLLTFFAFASPTLILNTLAFGHPLRTGYHFWVPGAGGESGPFALRFLPANLRLLWEEFTMSWSTFRVANIFGSGTHFTPAFLLLALTGLRGRRWNAFFFFAALSTGTFLCASLCYFYLDVRLYFPLIVLMVPVASSSMERKLHSPGRLKAAFSSPAIPLLYVLALAGFPSAAGYPPRQGAVQVVEAIRWADGRSPSLGYQAAAFAAGELPDEALVFADISPVYLAAVLRDGVRAAPVDGQNDYSLGTVWRYGRPEARRLAVSAFFDGRPVYALADHRADTAAFLKRLPSVPGTSWTLSAKNGISRASLYRLLKTPK